MGAALLGAGLLGAATNIGGGYLTSYLSGAGKIKGKTATDRRIREQYQTMVKDLRLAGLNPALAYGSANPTASATGTALAGQIGFDPGAGAASAMGAYGKAYKLTPEEALLNAQRRGVEAGTAKTNAETVVIEKGLPAARIQERLMRQVEGLIDRYMDKGVSPSGAHKAVEDLFMDKPTNSKFRQREKELPTWQPIRPTHKGNK